MAEMDLSGEDRAAAVARAFMAAHEEHAAEDLVARAERVAQAFHESYERLAPDHGYETREESAKPWSEVPEQNRGLMIAVCAELLRVGTIRDEPDHARLTQAARSLMDEGVIRDGAAEVLGFPHQDGAAMVLGPEVIASLDQRTITWRGMHFVRQDG